MGYNKNLAIFVYEHNIDIMMISEIHLQSKTMQKFHIISSTTLNIH